MAGHLHGSAADGNASRARIQGECAAPKFVMGKPACPPDQGSNARQNLFHPEGLRYIVVRPTVDPLYFFMPASARSQNEHGHEDARFPPAAKQGKPIDFRQTKVEYYRVILLGMHEEIGLCPVGGAVDGVPGLSERFRQLPGQEYLVLYDQNSQSNIYNVIG